MGGGDIFMIVVNVIFTFIASHIAVDKEFDEAMKLGAFVVIGVISVLYLIFGVLV